MQEILFKLGDKSKEIIGSSDWIGSFEVSMIINQVCGKNCKIIHCSDGGNIADVEN